MSIHGYTDSRGSAQYNKKLAAKRTEAIRAYFIKNGIPGKRIIAVFSIGENGLVNSCGNGIECTEEQHSKNRRVELKVYDLQEKALTVIK